MNLVDLYNGGFIVGLREKELEDILLNRHSMLAIKTESNGMLLLTNNKVVKCIRYYYKTKEAPLKKTNSAAIQCYNIQQHFDIKDIGVFSCISCHLRCIQKRRRKYIKRIYNI